ncbi:MAG: L,D-transpeptidase [Polyangiaceae bacterium]
MQRKLESVALILGITALVGGCHRGGATTSEDAGGVASTSAGETIAPASSVQVGHGELDTKAPIDAPKLAATVIAATIYKSANTQSRKLGYVRLGGAVRRDPDPVSGAGCKGDFYRVYPTGFACTDEFTTDLELPLVRAASRRPDLRRPLPYRYGFVRATAPQYLRIPTRAEQEKSEFQLTEHLSWYAEHEKEVQSVLPGANDIPLDSRGIARPNATPDPKLRLSTAMSLDELFGADEPNAKIPFWLEGGKRSIPNVSAFAVPEFAIFADRVRRKTGLSLVTAFEAVEGDFRRRFAVAVDLRLIPATKIKPDTGSPYHGVEVTESTTLPLAWVLADGTKAFKLIKGKDEAREAESLPRRVVIPLTGTARIKGGQRFYQTRKDRTRWLRAEDIAIAAPPVQMPDVAAKGEKWIDVSLRQQVLTLYEGTKPVYSTMVSTGRDGMGDPKTTLSTPQGTFRLRSKHIAAAMDSEENSAVSGGARASSGSSGGGDDASATVARLLAAEKTGKKLSTEDQRRLANVKKGRDPEYGVTRRRGSLGFELRDVPWIQYFASGYALHGAYWHDVFGTPRSHGCINLAPIDARFVFMWTDPPVPEGWHGINVGSEMGEGTTVSIRE